MKNQSKINKYLNELEGDYRDPTPPSRTKLKGRQGMNALQSVVQQMNDVLRRSDFEMYIENDVLHISIDSVEQEDRPTTIRLNLMDIEIM